MKYKDLIFGNVTISEPVILDLLKTPALQRLKDIDNAGYKPLWAKPKGILSHGDYSRFAHSVAVYLLVRKYGAPLEEQVAGLLHDVSHSAFSHCIDYVLDSGSQKTHNHQDNIHEEFVKSTKIPAILSKYGFNVDYILDDKNFPLKEKSLPDLCADRLEYSMRGALIFKECTKKQIEYFLSNLTVLDNNWVFKNFLAAHRYAKLFAKLNTIYYSGIHSAAMFRAVGDYLKYALSKKYITNSDLYTTDTAVVKKISVNLKKDAHLRLLFARMNNKIPFTNNPKDYDAQVFCKSRVVDPLCLVNGKLKRVSQINSSWKEIVKVESTPKEYFLKFER